MVIACLERMDYQGCESAGINFVTLRGLITCFRDVGADLCPDSCGAGDVENDRSGLVKTVAGQ